MEEVEVLVDLVVEEITQVNAQVVPVDQVVVVELTVIREELEIHLL